MHQDLLLLGLQYRGMLYVARSFARATPKMDRYRGGIRASIPGPRTSVRHGLAAVGSSWGPRAASGAVAEAEARVTAAVARVVERHDAVGAAPRRQEELESVRSARNIRQRGRQRQCGRTSQQQVHQTQPRGRGWSGRPREVSAPAAAMRQRQRGGSGERWVPIPMHSPNWDLGPLDSAATEHQMNEKLATEFGGGVGPVGLDAADPAGVAHRHHHDHSSGEPDAIPVPQIVETATSEVASALDAPDRPDASLVGEASVPSPAQRVLLPPPSQCGPGAAVREAVLAGDSVLLESLVAGAGEGGAARLRLLTEGRPPALTLAVSCGQLGVASALIRLGGPPLLEQRTLTGQTALHAAAACGHRATVDAILAAAPRTVDTTTPSGTTALHMAIHHGHPAVAELLLERGADPRRADSRVGTALHYAAQGPRGGGAALPALSRADLGLLLHIIDVGSSLAPALDVDDASGVLPPGAPDGGGSGRAPLDRPVLLPLAGEPEPQPSTAPPGQAAASGAQRGWTALHRACYAGQWRLVAALVHAGATPTLRDPAGRKPVQVQPVDTTGRSASGRPAGKLCPHTHVTINRRRGVGAAAFDCRHRCRA
eukprot:COSAG01_NODE_841_length_13175_cov_26.426124_2_plen_599_part_00